MPYTVDEHVRPTPDELRRRIPGWGADLDHANRPSVPRERTDLPTGAHWYIPERQPELRPRERSIEHLALPPVFGTVAPLKGFSGALRRVAYDRYSEGRAAHWLLLVAGDRVDVFESRVTALLRGKPDNLLTETGIKVERRAHPVASRFGRGRADVKHTWLDPMLIVAPIGVVVFAIVAVRRRRHSR